MAKYSDADKWAGTQDGTVACIGGREPIAQSWTSTNWAAYTTLDLVKSLFARVNNPIVAALEAKRWFFGNQEGIPDNKKGTDNLFESTTATNTRVFNPVYGVKATSDKVDALTAKVDALTAKVDALLAQRPSE